MNSLPKPRERVMSSLNSNQEISLSELALDIQFNAAILAVCRRTLPAGFDVTDNAPQTYEELVAHLDAGNRMTVYSAGAERTIYGDPEVNYAFRAWHDWCHWRGRHDFSLEGERATCAMQARHLVARFGESSLTRRWGRVLHAEIIGQREFFDAHGHFPVDQRAFVEIYLTGTPDFKME
jgi:hypothetical protein